MTFQLSPYTDKNKIFLVKKSNLSGRLDVNFYLPKYIDSENLIRNSEWGFKSISDVAERIVDGPFGSDLKAEEYQDSGFPLLRVSNIRTGSIDGELVYISSEKHNDLKRSKVFPNDVLLTKAGAILGYSAVFPSELIEGNITSHLVTITCTSKVNPYYLSYFFRSEIGQLQIYRWGNKSTRPELNTGEVKKILVTTPPLDIQNEIVYKFDSCYKAKYKKENEAQSLLDSIDEYLLGELGVTKLDQDADYLQSRIFMRSYRDVSGGRVDPYFYKNIYLDIIESLSKSIYERHRLGKLTTVINGYDSRDFLDDGIMYLRVSNIRKDCFLLDDVKYISNNSIAKDIKLSLGDVLVTRKGSYGVSSVVNDEVLSSVISSEIFLLKFHNRKEIDTQYVSIYLNSSIGQIIFDRIKTGAIMGHISQEALNDFHIVLPPIEKQREIVAHVSGIRERAKQLRKEAARELEDAKREVEAMILGAAMP